ncbi:(Fe-S)-binding protein [Belnapia rosea]|uniref:(Fe-S)-binding protein n=1 Tax=Belnapia rosea TaxID=938405 RepID=UPI000889ED14|nr:(Fe-S)-binding protein [Belnapia rosea]SDB65813.1 Cysteine-rich domain-containing protein [Belnapia rosea]
MAVGSGEQAIFWYGCNMTRHGEVIRATTRLLEAVGIEAVTTGGPASCCGSPKDANARINEGMARRTVQAFNATGRETVVTWCPSCHMNMQDSMAPVTPTNFETVHVTEMLHARREALRPLLTRPVPARVLLHGHLGFHGRVPVNGLVPDLLRLIPGLDLVEHPYRAPGHMCSSLTGVPGALADAQRATLAAMAETGADTLCTIFHSCHRENVGLEQNHPVKVVNWVHLLAWSAGWEAEDGYKAMRNAADPRAALGEALVEAAGEVPFARLVEPELRKPPPV